MAMNKTVLGALIKANVDALSPEDVAGRTALFEAIADAVITHIQTAATTVGLVVTAVAPPGGGPVVGTAAGGPGSVL